MGIESLILCSVLLFVKGGLASLDAEGIIGGRDADPLEFPYMISLRNALGDHICGGGIIADQYVLTAAHCVITNGVTFHDFPFTVVAGISHLDDDSDTRVEVAVQEMYIPNYYNHTYWGMTKHTPSGDIAVLKLKNKLNIGRNEGLSILDLPKRVSGKEFDSYLDVTAVLSGFGYDYMEMGLYTPEGNNTGQLHKANILIIDSFECKKRFSNPILDSQICAKMIEHDDSTHQGTCFTDSGSPLVVDNTVIGVVSGSNYLCDQSLSPGLYTRVTSHLDFVENALRGVTEGMYVATATQ